MEAEARIKELVEKLNKYNFEYYQNSNSLVSDQEFDRLLKELEDLEEANPDLILPESPTHRVGGTITKEFKTVKHRTPMLSLSNTYNEEELREWDDRVKKLIEGESYEYICELKFDGISLSMTYENGILTQGLTRGDGTQGDDITANVKTIKSLPLRVNTSSKLFEIRGEGYLPIKEFERINEERIEEGLEPHANPRNTASGTFKMQDSSVVASRNLDCYVYELLDPENSFKTHEESLKALKKMGFHVSNDWQKAQNIDEVIDFIKKWEFKRNDLDCATDGIVIKINDYEQREFLGYTAKSPRWAIAYKYKAESKSTVLDNVSFQVGRTGAITPVAELKPVELSQTIVKRATLHNADEIERLDLHIGDKVFVEKAGEIIPKITGVDFNARKVNNEGKKVEFPKNCPACNTVLIRQEGEAAYYCPNEKGCPPQIKGRIEHFIARKAMNIDSLGEGKIEILLENGLIQDASDLYDLHPEHLLGLSKTYEEENGKSRTVSFKEKTVENILKGIENSKNQPFEKVLYAIGIRFVGITTAEKIALHFKNIENLENATFEDLIGVRDVGEKVALSIIEYLKDSDNIHFIEKLKSRGLAMAIEESDLKVESNKLEGLKILYTGTFNNFSRKELEDKIKSNGGQLISSISKNLDYLIVGDKAGASKLEKADKLGIKQISEEEFLSLITS